MRHRALHNIMSMAVTTVAAMCLAGAMTSCFTGIEGTKAINLSREDKKRLAPTAEELLMQGIGTEPLGSWTKGREFLVSDDKGSIVFERESSVGDPLSKGDRLTFSHTGVKKFPDGTLGTTIHFTTPHGTMYKYVQGQNPAEALTTVTPSSIPMLIDLISVERADSLLRNRHVWTRTTLWYDEQLEKRAGRKFVPVDIVGVTPGNMVFPFKVEFIDDAGCHNFMLMGIDNQGNSVRTFANLFSLTDIRKKYPHIRDDVWTMICNSRVAVGMTKEECRLSLGNPREVNRGHDWSQEMDLWQYADGVWLRFSDGVLVEFYL